MKIRWSDEATDDLAEIFAYIEQDSAKSAARVVRTLIRGVKVLATFPRQGRFGKDGGTRELVFSPLPYVVIYQVTDQYVDVLRVLHGARQTP